MLEAGGARWRQGGDLQQGALSDLAAGSAERRVWLVDGRNVQLTEVELPAASRREQAQALPYALEEQLLTSLETLSFASHRLTRTRYACAVIDTAAVEAELGELTAAGIHVSHAIPDMLCIPWQESTWTLLFAGDDAWLRTGPYAGYRFPATQWRPFLEQSLLATSGDQHLRVFGVSDQLSADIAGVSAALTVESVPAVQRDVLELMAEAYALGATFDLLPALPRRLAASDSRLQRWWFATAAIVLVTAVAHAGFMVVHTNRLEHALVAAQASTLGTFHALFPAISRVQDVRVQATQALAERVSAQRTQTPFLDLLAVAGEPLVADAAGGLQLETLAYNNGALELRVRARDMTALEGYQQSLAGAQLPVTLLSVESRDDKAIGLLRIGSAP